VLTGVDRMIVPARRSAAGDVNGDGIAISSSALRFDAGRNSFGGASYVVFGSTLLAVFRSRACTRLGR
jgi:hypothetical protein